MTGKNSKSKKSKSGGKKGGHEQAATHVTPQKENVPDSAPAEKSPQRTFQGDELTYCWSAAKRMKQRMG